MRNLIYVLFGVCANGSPLALIEDLQSSFVDGISVDEPDVRQPFSGVGVVLGPRLHESGEVDFLVFSALWKRKHATS